MDRPTSRRRFMAGLITTAVLADRSEAAGSCSPFDGMGVQTCTVGLPIPAFSITPLAETQRMRNWCWAACISNIFAWYGRPVTQSDIVDKIYGSDIDQPASGEQIFNAVNGSWTDSYGRPFHAQAGPLLDKNFSFSNPYAAAIMSVDLLNDQPLIIGTEGHATVLTAMTYFNTVWGGQGILNLTVRDPWPYNENRRSLTQTEFQNASLVMQLRIS